MAFISGISFDSCRTNTSGVSRVTGGKPYELDTQSPSKRIFVGFLVTVSQTYFGPKYTRAKIMAQAKAPAVIPLGILLVASTPLQ